MTANTENRPTLWSRLNEWALDIFKRYSLPRWIVIIHDLIFVYLTFLLAYQLRFNFEMAAVRVFLVYRQDLIVLAVYLVSYLIFKSYAGLIRHTTIRDTFNILVAHVASLMMLLLVSLMARSLHWSGTFNIPLSILLIHFVLISVYLFFVRASIKMTFEFLTSAFTIRRNILIFGAGSMGVTVKRAIESEISSGFRVRGFIDDNRKLQGKLVNGHRVYDLSDLSADLIKKEKIEVIIIGVNQLPKIRKDEIVKRVLDLELEVFQAPTVDKWLHGQLTVKQLKKVNLEDLLGREAINLDLVMIDEGLRGKTILVTGAAGSIGSEIVRQLARFSVGKIILVDQAETPIFFLQHELSTHCKDVPIEIMIGDVTHPDAMEKIFNRFHPSIVFHAAAYKHVPLMEEHPHEAVRVNVGGTKNIAELAIRFEVEKFVLISSDKAVNPTNVMGASKRICELLVQALSQGKDVKTHFVITRFGNVLGSNGSVIPLFRKQIEQGGPVTITHPDITRFFMTIPEACQLVLEAGFMGKGGEIFIFDMGEPVKVVDLARQMIRLSGFIPGKEIEIIYTGLRAGEKLFEELIATSEITLPTHHPKIMIARNEQASPDKVLPEVEEILYHLYNYPPEKILKQMKSLVPEYISNNGNITV